MEIIYYETADGKKPASDFIDSLPIKSRQKVLRSIELLRALGVQLKRPYTDDLRDGIHELRTQFGSNQYRVLYFFMVGDKAILTNGFTKKTMKVPDSEIDLAISYRTDYTNRNK